MAPNEITTDIFIHLLERISRIGDRTGYHPSVLPVSREEVKRLYKKVNRQRFLSHFNPSKVTVGELRAEYSGFLRDAEKADSEPVFTDIPIIQI